MNLDKPLALPATHPDRRLRTGELSPIGATLTEEEMRAVAGAAPSVCWNCGSPGRPDEWVL